MEAILRFVRTTLVGGVLFLVPIVVLVVILGKAIAIARMLADPLAKMLGVESVIGLHTPVLLAAALVVAACFLAGLAARTTLGRRTVGGLEGAVLSKIPGYGLLKGLSQSVLGAEGTESFPVVLVRLDDASQVGWQIETLEDGRAAVYLPGAPDPRSGSVLYVAAERVQPLDATLASAYTCMRKFGSGSKELLRARAP